MDFEMVQELKSSTKVIKWLYLFDLLFIGCYLAIMFMFVGYVHPVLTIPYHVFNVIAAMILTSPSPFNPKKRIFQSLLFIAKKDNKVYRPISNHLAKQPTLHLKSE